MVVFDVVPQDFKVVKQSAVHGNTVVWQRPPTHMLPIKKKKDEV
jgi:hypothetical protein